jgi:hypothetical protein
VTDKIPATSLKRDAFEIPQNLELADPQFHVSAEIDVLIGAEHFWNLLCVGQVKSSPMHPTLHKTRFGSVLAGQLGASQNSAQKLQSLHVTVSNTQLHNQLSRFWRRWSQEYLHTLQERTKWKFSKGEQLKPKQMVLLKSQGLAPLQWSLGRVEEVHPGSDNIVRTATIRTARGLFTRPLSKIAILPIEE